jgi:hypothetical protein
VKPPETQLWDRTSSTYILLHRTCKLPNVRREQSADSLHDFGPGNNTLR